MLIAPADYVTLAVRFSSLMHLGAYSDPAVIVVLTMSAISVQGLLLYALISCQSSVCRFRLKTDN